MNTCTFTVEQIDAIVAQGKPLGEACEYIPTIIGDWSIRVVHSRGEANTGIMVAIPTGSRTRNIYQEGRKNWLLGLGYTQGQVDDYIKASTPVMYRWEDSVAKFVLANLKMSEKDWETIYRDKAARRVAQQLGYTVDMSQPRLMAALQIITNIWEL